MCHQQVVYALSLWEKLSVLYYKLLDVKSHRDPGHIATSLKCEQSSNEILKNFINIYKD